MEWLDRAKCKGLGFELFFPEGKVGRKGPNPTAPHNRDEYEEVVASEVCRGRTDLQPCEVVDECLHDALNSGYIDGVSGGLTSRQKQALIHRSKRLPHQSSSPE